VTGTRRRSGIVSRRVSPGLRVLVLSVATSMLGGRPLFAMPPSRGEAKVVVAGSDRSVASITKSLTESLSFIGVTAQFERAASVNPRSVAELHPPRESLLAYLWIDAAADHEVTLYITDAATERVFVRRIGLEHGLDTVAVESLALVAQSSLEALLAGKIIGVTRDDYEHSLDVAAPPPKPAPVPVKVEPPAPPMPEGQGTTFGRPAGNSRLAISCRRGTARPCAMKRTLALTMNAGRCASVWACLHPCQSSFTAGSQEPNCFPMGRGGRVAPRGAAAAVSPGARPWLCD
jgi:hypothetical protein